MVQSSSKLRLSPAGSSVRFVKDSPQKMQNISALSTWRKNDPFTTYSQDSHATKQDLSSAAPAALSSMTQSHLIAETIPITIMWVNHGKPSPIISNLQIFIGLFPQKPFRSFSAMASFPKCWVPKVMRKAGGTMPSKPPQPGAETTTVEPWDRLDRDRMGQWGEKKNNRIC